MIDKEIHVGSVMLDVPGEDYRLRSFAVPDSDTEGKVYYIRFNYATHEFELYAKLYQ